MGVKKPPNCAMRRPTPRIVFIISGVIRGFAFIAAAMPRLNSALIIGSSTPLFT